MSAPIEDAEHEARMSLRKRLETSLATLYSRASQEARALGFEDIAEQWAEQSARVG